jgi:hypothetical protein
MKKSLSLIVIAAGLVGALPHAATASTILYTEDWGSIKGGTSAGITNIGWTFVIPAANNPPYEGIYQAGPNPTDTSTGNPLPVNTLYYTGVAAGQNVMFYTVAGAGAGSAGDSSFTAIDPTQFKNVTLSVEANDEGSPVATNYFAVQVGGSWYVSATALTGTATAYPTFALASTPYTTTASAWNQLTINTTSVTIGAAASANLSGPITGVGIVEVGPGGWNYNEIVISATPSPSVYTEDWGSIKGGTSAGITNIGWTFVIPAANNPPYEGIYQAGPNPTDSSTGNPLPVNTLYYTGVAAGQNVMFYTVAGAGAGSAGDTAFDAINPAEFQNLTLSVEATDEGSPVAPNYFAVQVGGAWYVSTTALAGSDPSYPTFTLTSTPYTNLASAWNQLTINANSVTIGAGATANLSGPITGIGIVEVGPGGWNYNEIIVSASVPSTVIPPLATLYSEDWGTVYFHNTGTDPNTLPEVGWSSSGIAYTGMFAATGTFDPVTGETFPPPPLGNLTVTNNAVYASLDAASYIGIIYTTDTNGAGTEGDSAFADINPASYAGGIVFNAEAQYNNFPILGPATSYFAVQIGAVAGVGGQWYVSTTPFASDDYYPAFASNSLAFNPGANNWDTLAFQEGPVNATGGVTIGGLATNNLSGLITGLGVVEVGDSSYTGGAAGYGFNYVALSITTPLVNKGAVAPKIDAAGFSQTTYAGGTASFAVDAYVGTAPLTFTWTLKTASGSTVLQDGATGTGSVISGSDSNVLTIANVSSADAGTYSVEVGNLYGADYSTNYATNTLTVNPVPSDVLYAETFPFVGPFTTGESPTAVGWVAAAPAGTSGINYGDQLYVNTGSADVTTTSAATAGFFTSSATDVPGLSGLPFTNINPASFTFVSFRTTMANPAGTAAADANVYFAVQMTGGQWYVSSSAIQLIGAAGSYQTYGLQFSPNMLEWDTLSVSGTSASIGGTATANLTGDITGAGLVFVLSGAAPTEFDVQSFELVTNSTPPVLASFPSLPNVPYAQIVYQGGGASFYFTEAGTLPFTNNWQFNGATLTDGTTATGSIISGSQTTELTIENAGPADAGPYDPTVSNPAGTTDLGSSPNDTFGLPNLTVTPPPVGLIYSESFPLYKPTGGVNQPFSIIGWTNQSDSPNRIYSIGDGTVGTGSAYAYESGKTNSVFYASTTTDTGFSGLPFIAFDPANYPANSIQFTTAMIAGNTDSTNVSASFAIEEGGQWYAMATPVQPANPATPLPPEPTGAYGPSAYVPEGPQTYSPVASQWVTLTFVGTAGVIVGGAPAQNLRGPITAAGLLFQHGTAGGDINYDFYQIQALGAVGGLNIGPVVNGSATITWIGNPAVFLQSSTDLVHWTAVPTTQGNHMLTVSAKATAVFYRVAGPL